GSTPRRWRRGGASRSRSFATRFGRSGPTVEREQQAELDQRGEQHDRRERRAAGGRHDLDGRAARVGDERERKPLIRVAAPAREAGDRGRERQRRDGRERGADLNRQRRAEDAQRDRAEQRAVAEPRGDRERVAAHRGSGRFSRIARGATRTPRARASSRSSCESAGFHGAATCEAPYGEPPVRVSKGAARVYGTPTQSMPW